MALGYEADPVEIAASATRAGLFQDIVVATSRVLHREELSPDDRRALATGQELLRRAASAEPVMRISATDDLSDAPATLAVLQAAGASAAHAGYFKELEDALSRAAKGDRSKRVLERTNEVRQLFLAVNRAGLTAAIEIEQEGPSSQLPLPSTTNLGS